MTWPVFLLTFGDWSCFIWLFLFPGFTCVPHKQDFEHDFLGDLMILDVGTCWRCFVLVSGDVVNDQVMFHMNISTPLYGWMRIFRRPSSDCKSLCVWVPETCQKSWFISTTYPICSTLYIIYIYTVYIYIYHISGQIITTSLFSLTGIIVVVGDSPRACTKA